MAGFFLRSNTIRLRAARVKSEKARFLQTARPRCGEGSGRLGKGGAMPLHTERALGRRASAWRLQESPAWREPFVKGGAMPLRAKPSQTACLRAAIIEKSCRAQTDQGRGARAGFAQRSPAAIALLRREAPRGADGSAARHRKRPPRMVIHAQRPRLAKPDYALMAPAVMPSMKLFISRKNSTTSGRAVTM